MSDALKIQLKDPREVMLSSPKFSLGDRNVGLLNADVSIRGVKGVIRKDIDLWDRVFYGFGIPNWWNGVIRIDSLITAGDVCPIEVNVLGPECTAALSQAYLAYGRELELENPVEYLAQHLNKWARGRTILFLLADNEDTESKSIVKRTWGPALLTCLQMTGLDIHLLPSERFRSMSPQEFERYAMFAFGDVVPDGARVSQFTQETCAKLSALQFDHNIPVFNSILPSGINPGNKLLFEQLLGRSPIPLDSIEKLDSIGLEEYGQWVIKPAADTGGNGICNGSKVEYGVFFDKMTSAIERGGYFLSRRFDPITIILCDREWVPDMNLAYIARGHELFPLHAVVRLKPIEEFNVDGTTNVSRGACVSYRIPLPV